MARKIVVCALTVTLLLVFSLAGPPPLRAEGRNATLAASGPGGWLDGIWARIAALVGPISDIGIQIDGNGLVTESIGIQIDGNGVHSDIGIQIDGNGRTIVGEEGRH